MKYLTTFCFSIVALAVADGLRAQTKDGKKDANRVIVLIDSATEGLDQNTKVARIEVSMDSGKNDGGMREIKAMRSKGKEESRLNGIYVVKTCNIELSDGKTLKNRELLLSFDIGKQPLQEVRFLESCEGLTDKGAGRWFAYTAEFLRK